MAQFVYFGIFLATTMLAFTDAQTCNPALIDPDGTAVCPAGTTLSGTTCCYTDTSTPGCTPALEENGAFFCPTTLTLRGTVCCPSTSTNAPTCVDLVGPRGVSDCPSRAYLCNDSVYYTLMTQQCPRTCNRCSSSTSTGNTSSSTTCVDLAAAGRASDCPSRAYLCTNAAYATLMRQQCPRTCGFCTAG